MPYGYNGKILHVDLTKGELTVEEPEEAFYRKYLGGSAMGMHYILREMPKGADPLGPAPPRLVGSALPVLVGLAQVPLEIGPLDRRGARGARDGTVRKLRGQPSRPLR